MVNKRQAGSSGEKSLKSSKRSKQARFAPSCKCNPWIAAVAGSSRPVWVHILQQPVTAAE